MLKDNVYIKSGRQKNMKDREATQIIIAIFILSIVLGFTHLISLEYSQVGFAILFAFIIISINILSKKFIAAKLDSNVIHEIWQFQKYGFKPSRKFKRAKLFGVIIPLLLTAFSIGSLKVMSILTYETTALKRRAARRHGAYSYTEMTDWHIALIGAGGIIATLLIAFISYWIPGLQLLTKGAIYYTFWNMIPFSKLDGTQIYMGSRVLWTTLEIITVIFTLYAVILV